MQHTQHPSNNDVLGAPLGVSLDECHALAITRVQYQNGMPAVRSYWRPNAAELEALQKGALVCLEVWGGAHAPLLLTVDGVNQS